MTDTKKKPVRKPAARPAAKAAKKAPAKKAAAPKAEARRPARRPASEIQLPPATGLHGLAPASGSTHSRKRVGRGPGSGHGKTASRGNKGQRSRSGYTHLRGFEGGQMPLHRRLPKRGFTNVFRRPYDPVNLSKLSAFPAGQEITPELLHSRGLAGKNARVKILGEGEVGKALVVRAHKFSASAKEKIEKAGGRCEIVAGKDVEKVAP